MPPVSGDYFFAPPSPRTSRQAQGNARGPINLAIGPVEKYTPDPPHREASDESSDIQVSGAPIGGDWMRDLRAWWVEHRRYPQQAINNDEQGVVVIRFNVNRVGHVSGAKIISHSGSQWLDAQAMATFGNARLPPLPFNVPEDMKTVTISINYQLIRQ